MAKWFDSSLMYAFSREKNGAVLSTQQTMFFSYFFSLFQFHMHLVKCKLNLNFQLGDVLLTLKVPMKRNFSFSYSKELSK